jgi:hypothetical protein
MRMASRRAGRDDGWARRGDSVRDGATSARVTDNVDTEHDRRGCETGIRLAVDLDQAR